MHAAAQNLVDPSEYLNLYPAAFAPLKSEFNLNAIQQLYSSVDFIGISSYASNTPGFSIDQLESATYQFATEIASFGVDVPDLIFNQVTSLHWIALLHAQGWLAPDASSLHLAC